MASNIDAKNTSSGKQYLANGQGDQNAVHDHGTQYNDHSDRRNITINVPGSESIWQLARALTGRGNELDQPTCASIISWLKRQPDLSPLDAHNYHLELCSHWTPGTGTWFRDTDEFQAWKSPSTSSRFLLMQGILGSGKTILASRVIESVREDTKTQSSTACIYFYFEEENDDLPQSRIWATLLMQLLQHECPKGLCEELVAKFTMTFQGSPSFQSREYLDLFKAQVTLYDTVYLVWDSLDNFPKTDAPMRQTLPNMLLNLPSNVKILFTSRTDLLARQLGAFLKLRVTPRVSDIETYIHSRIDRDVALHPISSNTQLRQDVVKQVTKVACDKEMFLLARLHLDHLSKQRTPGDIKDALCHLPASPGSAFDVAVMKIKQKHDDFERNLARHVLTWVVHAKANLNVAQLRDSFAISQCKNGDYKEYRHNSDSLVTACAGLVAIDSETGGLSLVHESVQAHLRERDILHENADLFMAKTCLNYLLVDEAYHDEHAPLLPYAATHWITHSNGTGCDTDEEIKSLTSSLLGDGIKLARAFKAVPGAQGLNPDGMTGLHAAVYFDHLEWARGFVENPAAVEAPCADGQTPLHWAVVLRRVDQVKLLIENSADPNTQDRSRDGPLHKALKGPATDADLVKLLVTSGARVDVQGAERLSAVSSAIRYEPTNIAEIFLRNQADVNAEIYPGWTSLREVFNHGSDIVESLGSSAERWEPLARAVETHAHRLIDVLLERGIDLNSPSRDGWLPLIHAVKIGSTRVVKKLLTRKLNPANINIRDLKERKSPLRWAFYYERLDLIHLLIEHGADVNETNSDGWTPLIQAVKDNMEDTVWLLLKKHANPDTLDGKRWPALLYAIQSRQKNLVWLLITNNADVRAFASKALSLSLEGDDTSIAWLICEHGAGIHVIDDNGMTLLHQAVVKGDHSNFVRFLLDRGALLDQKDNNGHTPLHHAVLRDDTETVALLAPIAARQKCLDVQDTHGYTALVLATLNRNRRIMQTLLKYRASCNIQDPGGLTALHLAADMGFNGGLQILLRKTEEPNLPDSRGYTAVHHAVNSEEADAQTFMILGDAGVDFDAMENEELTPLMLAVHLGKQDVVRQLLDEGANVHLNNTKGWTPLALVDGEDQEMREIIETAMQPVIR